MIATPHLKVFRVEALDSSIRSATAETASDTILSSASVAKSAMWALTPYFRRIARKRTIPSKLARYSSSSFSFFLSFDMSCSTGVTIELFHIGFTHKISCVCTKIRKRKQSQIFHPRSTFGRISVRRPPYHPQSSMRKPPRRLPASIPLDAVGACGVGLIFLAYASQPRF